MRSRALFGLTVAATLAISLLPTFSTPAQATFPGHNGLIAWSKTFLRHDAEIWVMDPDGTNQRQLSHNDRTDFDPAWSIYGTKLAYTSCTGEDCDVWVMNADGTDEHDVSNDPSGPDIQPAWSLNGGRIAFVKQRATGSAIWVMNVDGSNQVQLTDDTSTNVHPNWSYDEKWIVFSSDRAGNLELYKISPDGTDRVRLTFSAHEQEDNPTWSPDQQYILYDECVAASFPCPGTPNYEIFVMRADGTNHRRLTADPSIDWNATWSPDQTLIVFRSDRSPDGTELYVMEADGSNVVQLTFGPYQGGVDPDWQPVPDGGR
jgi:Tol biopolymer transport system component